MEYESRVIYKIGVFYLQAGVGQTRRLPRELKIYA